jgi:hypothetical protein
MEGTAACIRTPPGKSPGSLRRRGITRPLICGVLAWVLLSAGPGPAFGGETVPLDRALEAAALDREDVSVRLEDRKPPRGSPLFEQWMSAPLGAPVEARRLALRLLSLAAEPAAWPAALPLLEGRDLPGPLRRPVSQGFPSASRPPSGRSFPGCWRPSPPRRRISGRPSVRWRPGRSG